MYLSNKKWRIFIDADNSTESGVEAAIVSVTKPRKKANTLHITMANVNEMPLAEYNSPEPIKFRKPKTATPRARAYVRSKIRVTYCNESDSDEENQPKQKKRILPEWLVQLESASRMRKSEKQLVITKNDVVDESLVSPLTPISKHNRLLRKKFNHDAFRPKQWEIIKTLMIERRDVVGVMATGYGKSLCFQYPAVCLNGITLVVSPLIALMQDQVMDLQKRGISACLLGSAQPDKNMPRRAATGEYRLVYASPEFLTSLSGKLLLEECKNQIRLIAIDEAHCVSQWGLDFRPEYRQLSEIRDIVPNVPILALTATATADAREDIATNLKLTKPKFIVSSFDRPNLEFAFYPKTEIGEWNKYFSQYDYWKDLKSFLSDNEGTKIIYVLTRKETEKIANVLKEHGIKSEHYHAGLLIDERTEKLEKFKNGEIQVIVATIAFGMGIDKRDVRAVIHYGAASRLEMYYQEVGRAGRDGQSSKAVTFFSPADFRTHDWFLSNEKLPTEHREKLAEQQRKMREFLYSRECRR